MASTKINKALTDEIGALWVASGNADIMADDALVAACLATAQGVDGGGTTVNALTTVNKASVVKFPHLKGKIPTSPTTMGYRYRAGLWLLLPAGDCTVGARDFTREYLQNKPQDVILAAIRGASDRADAITKINEAVKIADEAARAKSAGTRAAGAAGGKAPQDDAPDAPDAPQDDAPQDDAPQDDAPDAPQDGPTDAPRAAALAAVERWLTTADAWTADDVTVASAIVAALGVATDRVSVTA